MCMFLYIVFWGGEEEVYPCDEVFIKDNRLHFKFHGNESKVSFDFAGICRIELQYGAW